MHLGDLEKDFQQKLEQDRKRLEALHSQELEKLRQNLEKECQSALNTIRAATDSMKQSLNTQLKWCSVLPAVTLLSLLGGSFIASWVMTRSLINQAQQIQAQKETLKILHNQTWGLELYQTQTGRFVILPPHSRYKTNWFCNGKPCFKL